MKAIPKILMGAKDFNGKYIQANENLLKVMGYEREKQLIGRSEYDVGREVFIDSLEGSDVLVEKYYKEDELVFSGAELNTLCVHNWRDKLRFLMSYKAPYLNEKDKIIGSVFYSYEIQNPKLSEVQKYLFLQETGLIISEQSQKHIHWYLNEFLKNIPLSQRELECVNLLAKGKTAKEIGIQLNLSYRTVEFYLDNARLKLQCTNRYELIAKSLQQGWLDVEEGM